MYTLLCSARNHGVYLKVYLKDVIERLPPLKANEKAGIEAMMTANWAAEFKNRLAAEQVPATNAA